MLPPGHIAGGYLVTKAFFASVHPALSSLRQEQLVWWGMFFGFAPDLDTFFVFFKMKRFISSDKVNHRHFYSHAPLLWLLDGLAISFAGYLSGDAFLRYFGLVAWLGSWSHFALDTIQHGVMWLWPWSEDVYALRDRNMKTNIPPQNFISYWLSSLRWYVTRQTVSFVTEVVLVVLSLFVYFR